MNRYSFDAVKHVHYLDGQPLMGTSSVGDVLFKPLAWWAAGEAVKTLGWTHPCIKKNGRVIGNVPIKKRLTAVKKIHKKLLGTTPEEYLQLLDTAYKAHSVSLESSAERGSQLHADLETYAREQEVVSTLVDTDRIRVDLNSLDPRVKIFSDWAEQNIKRYLWIENHCYDEELWVGGISDVGVELNDGSCAIIDYKSSKEAYTSNFIQAAGYIIQAEKNGLFDCDGNLITKLDRKIDKIIIFPFGAKEVEPEIRDQVSLYKEGFQLAVKLYKVLGLDKKLS